MGRLFAVLLGLALTPLQAQVCNVETDGLALESQQQVNDFQTDYGPCNRLDADLAIDGAAVSNLEPLSDLTEIRGDLTIHGGPALQSLQGLSGLELVYWLTISQTALTDLSGLSSLEVLYIGLTIYKNPDLVSLDGLPALTTVCCVFEVMQNISLERIGNLTGARVNFATDLRIESNPELLNLVGLPAFAVLDSLTVIANAKLQNLQGLDVDSGVVAHLVTVQHSPLLTNLDGMQWLESVGTLRLYKNDALLHFHGLSGLERAEMITVNDHAALLDFAGLESLQFIGDLPGGMAGDSTFVGNFWIDLTPGLTSLKGLSGLERMEGSFNLNDVTSLASVADLSHLRAAGGLGISGSQSLVSLEGLSALRAVDNIGLVNNPLLSDCSALIPLFDIIDHDDPGPGPGEDDFPDVAGQINLQNNAPGCNSLAEFAPPRPKVAPILTGSWFDPASSGEGFMIHTVKEHITGPLHVQNGLAVGYFYGYDESGERFWLIGIHNGSMNWGEPISFTANSVSGGQFGAFDAANIVEKHWGSFKFTPQHCDAGVITLNGQFDGVPGVKEKSLQVRRLGKVAGTYCAQQVADETTDSLTASWFDPQTSGQGFAFHKIGDTSGVVYFYGFDAQGQPLWLIGVWDAPVLLGETLEIPMSEVIGGTFSEVDPNNIVESPWGVLRLQLDSCDSGEAELVGLDGEHTLHIQQLAASLGLECSP